MSKKSKKINMKKGDGDLLEEIYVFFKKEAKKVNELIRYVNNPGKKLEYKITLATDGHRS